MMHAQDLLQWWNLIYAIPLAISLVWIVATAVSGAHTDGHAHGHTEGNVGHVAHAAGHAASHVGHHHADVGHGHGHAHADHGHGHDAHGHGHAHSHAGGHDDGFFDRLLWFLGFGQIPVMLLIGTFMLCWGAFGLVVNRFLESSMKYPAVYILPSVGVTFGVSFVFTRLLASVIARIMPTTETFGVSRLELVGSLGKTIYATGESTGTVDIRDSYGTVHRVQAKVESGEESIPSGAEVMVIDFDEEDKRFVVRRSVL